MKLIVNIVWCVCVNFAYAGTYKAAVSDDDSEGNQGLLSHVYEAGRKGVDVMVLPNDVFVSEDYDENLKAVSKAAKQAGLYLVAHLREKTRCQNKHELVRTNLVFDRDGAIVSAYRKPENSLSNCTTTTPGLVTFDTDFGVSFGLMMEEDLVLNSEWKDLRNFVMAGAWSSEIPYLSASQFSATWAYTHNVNLVSPSGIYAGKAGGKGGNGELIVAELSNICNETAIIPPVFDTKELFPSEDLSQYIIRPLDVIASTEKYEETVCHNSFCCRFDVKTSKGDHEVSYGLAAFNGIRHYGGNRYIGTQNCAIFACAGLYKRSCSIGSNNTNIVFEKLVITTNFTQNSVHYPMIVSKNLSPEQYSYVTTTSGNTLTVETKLTDGDSLLTFGISGRVFDRDYESYSATDDSDFYNSVFTEDVQEFFDYLWIRIRILLFLVSIYILEML